MDEDQPLATSPPRSRRYPILLLVIWLIGVVLDRLWLWLDYGAPQMSAAQHLTRLLYPAPSDPLQNLASPLFYRLSAVWQSLGATSLDQLLWIQSGVSALLLLAVYGLGARLFSRQVGLWSVGFCVLLPALLAPRLQFSWDLSWVAFVMLSLWRLVVWRQAGRSPWPSRPTQPESELNELAVAATASQTFPLEPDALPWERELQRLRQTIATRATAAELLQRSPSLWERWLDIWQPMHQRLRFLRHLRLPSPIMAWVDAILLGLSLGLACLAHPWSVVYLIGPFLLSGLGVLYRRAWWQWLQWLLAGLITWTIVGPWYRRTLPDLVLARLRAPQLNESPLPLGLAQWTGADALMLVRQLAEQLFYPLLLVGILGLLLYHQRVVSVVMGRQSLIPAAMRHWRRQVKRVWSRAIVWVLFCALLPLGLSLSLTPFSSVQLLPIMPLLVLVLTQGLLLFPPNLFQIRWFLWALIVVWSVSNLFPLVPLRAPQKLAQPNQNWHQVELLKTIAQESPGVQPTIGVLTQTEAWNADYLAYLSRGLKLSIVPTRLGLDVKHIWQDRRTLPWYVVQTGLSASPAPGTIPQTLPKKVAARKIASETARNSAKLDLAKAIRNDAALQLSQTWKLPNNEEIQLFRRRQSEVVVTPIVGAQWSEDLPIRLEKVIAPAQAQVGQPIPVSYVWAGQPQELQTGLVELTWRRVNDGKSPAARPQWWHDHGIGLGQLQPLDSQAELVQVTEQLAMIAPAGSQGRYELEAQYFDPIKQARYPLTTPSVKIEIVNQIKSKLNPQLVPELDLITQWRLLSRSLMRKVDAAQWQQKIGRLDRYDPMHRTVQNWQQITRDRLMQQPDNAELYADLALARFLLRDMPGASAALERLQALQPKNLAIAFYRAIVEAAQGNIELAQSALNTAQQLDPKLSVPDALQVLMNALRGNPLDRGKLYLWRLNLLFNGMR